MLDFYAMLGFTNNATIDMLDQYKASSNIITTDNPPYDLVDFSSAFPVFPIGEGGGAIPTYVFNLFLDMANAAIKEERYKTSWKFLMGLYIAHFLTLYLRTQQGDASAQNALAGSLPTGLASSKSVDGLSISYDFTWANDSDFEGYGTFKQTEYGQQLITLTKPFGHAGMWING